MSKQVKVKMLSNMGIDGWDKLVGKEVNAIEQPTVTECIYVIAGEDLKGFGLPNLETKGSYTAFQEEVGVL